MNLPTTLRDTLVDELDEYLESFGSDPDPEALVAYLIELVEAWADEVGFDDVITELEEAGALEEALADALEAEMSSNSEFTYTGEEVASLLERMCEVEWDDDVFDDEDVDPDEPEDV